LKHRHRIHLGSLKQEKSEHGSTQKSWVVFPTLQNLTLVFSTLALEFKLNYSTNKRKYFNLGGGGFWFERKTKPFLSFPKNHFLEQQNFSYLACKSLHKL